MKNILLVLMILLPTALYLYTINKSDTATTQKPTHIEHPTPDAKH